MRIKIKGIECNDENDAMERIDADNPADRRRVISIGNKLLVLEPAEADRIAAMGIEFAYLFDHEMPDGTHRLITVPVND
jgi:hypothetical protein